MPRRLAMSARETDPLWASTSPSTNARLLARTDAWVIPEETVVSVIAAAFLEVIGPRTILPEKSR
ncbi:hypothetical protein GCM10025789_12030 [Tessaracoccus lubricantis]|uniref:Uncharacterized protein n=1 Tax=Tessaracoccus lubricantis TaxID=545543 RepID=A0ABP9FH43_9ACTN